MSLRFNTHRQERYFRTRFVEGRFLLASENTDLELEITDKLRELVKQTLGDVALDDSWKVERLSDTQLLVRTGLAWRNGIPFEMRSSEDHLVSGGVLSAGITPAGVTIIDDAQGRGKVITLNDGATTPADTYRIVLTAREELVTNVEDPFLKNANLSESTAQKTRITIKINIVSESDQTETPLPYTNDESDQNLVNKIVVSPTAAGNGELLSTNILSGSEEIDGRDLELVIRNDSGLGSGNPIPDSSADQQAFFNGKLIDSLGNEFHINAVFNDTVSTQVVLRIDKEVDQENPVLTNGSTYTIEKRNIFATDDINGNPVGKLFFPIATVDWDDTDGIVHSSKVTDLRENILSQKEFEELLNQKVNLDLLGGGSKVFDSTAEELSWGASFSIINAFGPEQTIASNTVVLVDGGSLVYELDLESGGSLEKGNLAVTVNTAGATSTLASVDLSDVRIGNIVKDSGGVIAEITAVDNVNDQITTSPALSNTGVATIYLDSFGPGSAPLTKNSFTLATRKGSTISVAGINIETNLDFAEDRSAYLRSDDAVVWDGSQLEFTSDIVLEIVNTKLGSVTQHTIQVAESPISLTDGEFVWVTIDRSQATENLTVNKSGTTPLPALDVANDDNFIIFRRQDAAGLGFLHVPFHKQVIEPGQSVRLGASGSGSEGAGNLFIRALENQLENSTFDALTQNIFSVNGEDRVASSTASFNANDDTFEFSGVGENVVSTQSLDSEFLGKAEDLKEVQLTAFWRLDADEQAVDDAATYEVSRDGGNEWQAVPMERIADTGTFQGSHTFSEEASDQTIDEYAVGNADGVEALNDTTQQNISQPFTLANAAVLKADTVYLNKLGSPLGKFVIRVVNDDSGNPSTDITDILYESSRVDISALSTGDIAPTVDLFVPLAAGTYHVVIVPDQDYRDSFNSGVDELRVRVDSSSPSVSDARIFNGTAWSQLTGSAWIYLLEGRELDLRVRVTSSQGSVKLKGFGVFYDESPGEAAGGIKKRFRTSFNSDVSNLNEFDTGFQYDPDLLRVYLEETGQVFVNGAFQVSGTSIIFPVDTFKDRGQITLLFQEERGSSFDGADDNALLLAENNLGSLDPSIDRSNAGRGIILRRDDGQLVELALEDDGSGGTKISFYDIS